MSDEPAPKKTNKKLGRGLSALLGEDEDEDQAQLDRLRQTRSLPIERLAPGPFQPRRRFDEEELRELSESIRENGVLQPILVRRDPEGEGYQIIAGERRWLASQMAQLHEVPVLVREFDDRTAMEIALVENVQRKDLGPLEEAEGYRRLTEDYGHSQEAIARAVAKSRSHVANMMRLLLLPEEARALLDDGQLTMGHARALLSAEDPSALARIVVTRKLNVRETERLVQNEKAGGAPAASKRSGGAGKQKDADTRVLEEDLTERLGLTVAIDHNSKTGAGLVTIRYGDLDQLDLIVERLSNISTGSAERAPFTSPDFSGELADNFEENMRKASELASGLEDDTDIDPDLEPGDDEDDDDDPLAPKA